MKRSVVLLGVAAVFAALIVGGLVGRWTASSPAKSPGSAAAPSAPQVFTCSMHPQVRLASPGACPICEMPLIPAQSAAASGDDPPSLLLSEHARAMASVETVPVEWRRLTRDLRTVGKVQYHEPSLATVTARVDGYAEKLFVNVTGVAIKAGDHLLEVYSPDLLLAEQELLIALRQGDSGPLVESSRIKLRNWGMTEKQINDLVAHRKLSDRITLYSPITGTVIEKTLVENSAFKAGDVLYRIANLDAVWVHLDIYEYDLPWVRYGQRVELTAESLPGQVFSGRVTFVEPTLNEQTRTVRVPIYVENLDHALKPGMFVSAVIRAALGSDGRAAPTGVEGKFTCPMHPQVLRDEAGACPMCRMPLEQVPGAPAVSPASPAAPAPDRYLCPMKCEGEKSYDKPGNCPVCHMRIKKVVAPATPPAGMLPAIPAGAVLDSGTRRIVYVEKERGHFEAREVLLGPRSGGWFPVLKGVAVGERVVARGGFLIDSQFQITGRPSLYYPGGLAAPAEPSAPAAPGIHKH